MALCGVIHINAQSSQATEESSILDDKSKLSVDKRKRIGSLIETITEHENSMPGFRKGIVRDFHKIRKIGSEGRATVDYE